MDKNIAKYVAKAAFRASADLGDLIPFIKEHCCNDDYEKFRGAIVSASATIGLDVLNLVFENHPEIKQEFEEDVKNYGRIL
jgi:hypothetical protein